MEEFGQSEIVQKLKEVTKEEQEGFINQINDLDKACRGGIKDYIKRAKILLANSEQKKNLFHEYKMEVSYDMPHITVESEEFYEFQKLGFNELKTSVFVLVPGGLRERLWYKWIKIRAITELLTLRAYIKLYIESLLAYENGVRKSIGWLVHTFLYNDIWRYTWWHCWIIKKNSYFGMGKNQIMLIK